MARLNDEAEGISRVLPEIIALHLFDAAHEESARERIKAINEITAYAKKHYPKFFYTEAQEKARERRYVEELEARRQANMLKRRFAMEEALSR